MSEPVRFKTPIRVEFLEQGGEDNWERGIGFNLRFQVFHTAVMGLPIFLYYADKMARMPKQVISMVTESYLVEQATRALHRLGLSDVRLRDVLLDVTQKFRREIFMNVGAK